VSLKETNMNRPGVLFRWLALTGVAMAAAGCNTDMWRQPKTEPLDESNFFTDGMGSRPLVPGTIARDHMRQDDAYFTGFKDGAGPTATATTPGGAPPPVNTKKLVDTLPMPVTMDLLKRGQDRFNIYCVPCHGRLGDGEGMIAKRGFKLRRPVGNYHTERLRKMPIGHFYDVITNGYGAMFSYAARIEPQDRWAIAAYIRVLQLSQHATPADADAAELEKSTHPAPPATEGGATEGGENK